MLPFSFHDSLLDNPIQYIVDLISRSQPILTQLDAKKQNSKENWAFGCCCPTFLLSPLCCRGAEGLFALGSPSATTAVLSHLPRPSLLLLSLACADSAANHPPAAGRPQPEDAERAGPGINNNKDGTDMIIIIKRAPSAEVPCLRPALVYLTVT